MFKHLKIICVSIILVGIVINFYGKMRNVKPTSETRVLMDTFVRFDVCSGDKEKVEIERAFSEAWDSFENIAKRYNVYDAGSEISKINASYPNKNLVRVDTFNLIKSSVSYHEKTNGAFNIAIGPLMRMWKRIAASNSSAFLSEESFLELKKATDVNNIVFFKNNVISLNNPKTKIDLSGVAKGYAVDEAVKVFKKNGFYNFLIDAGGDMFASGLNCEGKLWRVGVRDPEDGLKIVDVLSLTDVAVTTSGSYERSFNFGNDSYSHIVNPFNMMPQRDVVSATVVAPSAQEADVYSTALCVLGVHEGTALIEKFGEKYASMIISSEKSGRFAKNVSKHYKKYK